MRRFYLQAICLLLLLVSSLVGVSSSGAQRPRSDNDPLNSAIIPLENKSALSSEELLRLGAAHLRMGEFFQLISRWGSLTIAEAARCYGDSVKHGAGAEFFGALAMLEAGKPQESLEFCRAAKKAKLMPQPLKQLTLIVESFAVARNSGKEIKGWTDFHPTSYWDSLVIALQLAKTNPAVIGAFPTIRSDTLAGGVTGSPLILHARLMRSLAMKDTSQVRTLLLNLNDNGIPYWLLRHSDGFVTRFCDPAITGGMAKAHFWLSRGYFERAERLSTLKTWSPRDALNYARTLFRQADAAAADKLIQSLPEKLQRELQLQPYKGWALLMQGQASAGIEILDKVRDSKDYLAQTELLTLAEQIPEYETSGDQLVSSLVAEVSAKGASKTLHDTPEGRKKLMTAYRAAGSWELNQEDFVKACGYYSESCLASKMDLKAFTLTHCCGYFFAKRFCSRPDFFLEAYQGFLGLAEYIPSAGCLKEPLNVLKFCLNSQEQ